MSDAVKTREEVAKVVEEQFHALDASAQSQPGLDDLLRVYGQYDAAVKQADEYFAILNPAPTFTTKNSSG